MVVKKLRVTDDPYEISSFFREYIRLECPVLLWQNMDQTGSSNAKRVVFSGQFSLINEDKNYIVLTYKAEENQEINFDRSSTLYIKGTIQSILFKNEISFHNDGKIIMEIPKEVRVCEKRDKPRVNFGYNFEGKVEFFNYKAYRSQRKHSSAKLVDISVGGFAMLMFTGKAHSYSVGDTIQIVNINGAEFPEPITSTIRYIRTVRITRNNQGINAYRFGVMFKEQISESELSRILSQSPEPGLAKKVKAG